MRVGIKKGEREMASQELVLINTLDRNDWNIGDIHAVNSAIERTPEIKRLVADLLRKLGNDVPEIDSPYRCQDS